MKIPYTYRGLTSLLLIAVTFGGNSCAGNSKPATAGSPSERGFSKISFLQKGHQRSALIYTPVSLSGRTTSWPVLFALHGGGGSAEKLQQQTHLSKTADKYGFLLVYPDAGGRQWNDGRMETNDGKDDVGYMRQLLNEVKKLGPINAKRIYAAGISNGGMMSLRLACELTEFFDGFGVLSASFPEAFVGKCSPSKKVSIVFFHGSSDPLMPWAGGSIRAGTFRGKGGKVIGLPRSLEFWRSHNGCSGQPATKSLKDIDPNDGTTVERREAQNCKGGSVIYYHIESGGHSWPGKAPARGIRKRLVGATTQDIEAGNVLAQIFFGEKQ